MAADEFEIEGPQSANALVAATAAQIANEPWADGDALVFAIADGKLHPVPIVPAGGAIVSVSGVAPISVSPGIAPIVSLTGIVGEANGGFGASALTFGTGLLKRTGAATYTTVTDTLTVTAGTGLSGGGSVALGGSTSLSVSYGTTSGTATQGNDTRLAPAPSGAGKMLYDTGTAYSALTAGSTGQVLVGGSAPSFGSVPAAAITALTGTITGTYTLGGTPSLATTALTGQVIVANGGTGLSTLTAHGVLMGAGTSNLVVSTAGTAGQVFTSAGASADGAYTDPITSVNGSAYLSSSTFSLSMSSGTFENIGLSVSLPAAGTYLLQAIVRTQINSATAGAYLVGKFYNATAASYVSNSETMLVQLTTGATAQTGQACMSTILSVSGASTIRVDASRNGAVAYTTTNINSDSNGYTSLRYVKLNYA